MTETLDSSGIAARTGAILKRLVGLMARGATIASPRRLSEAGSGHDPENDKRAQSQP